MHANLIRPCVGVDSPEMLFEHQQKSRHLIDSHGKKQTYFTTRNTPKRASEILNGGSVYWITKGVIRMRQTITNIEALLDENNKKYCRITTSPEIMLVEPIPHRAMQGWRYFEKEKEPRDLYPLDPNSDAAAPDPKMAKQLAEAGLL